MITIARRAEKVVTEMKTLQPTCPHCNEPLDGDEYIGEEYIFLEPMLITCHNCGKGFTIKAVADVISWECVKDD